MTDDRLVYQPATQDPIARTIWEAMRLVAELPVPTPEIHTFPLTRVVGRVLAQDFVAPFPVPGFVRSRLDGFAVHSADLKEASAEKPVLLRVIATVPAGSWPVPPINVGECVRIMAGAPLPDGADAVIGFEDLERIEENTVRITSPVAPGTSIGRPDIDAARGELLLGKGTRLSPIHMGRLAGIGTTNVPVFSRPRVAVLSTGSELLLAGMPPSPGKIFNSSQTVLCGLLESAGAIPLPCGIARDDVDAIAQTMVLALRDNTMLITTGGVGHGDFDCIREAMRQAGAEILLAGGNFRPGGNLAIARLNAKYILSLSGAPGSALLMLHLLGLPLIRRLTGDRCWEVEEVDVVLASLPTRAPYGLLPGRLGLEGGRALFHPLPMLALERQSLDLVLPLTGREDLAALVREKTPLKAFWLHN